MVSWSVELSKFDIHYEPRMAIKAQVLTDFLAKMMGNEDPQESGWLLHIDRAPTPRDAKSEPYWKKKVKSSLNSPSSSTSRFQITRPSIRI